MTDETLSKIKEVNQRLSDLCGLPYTDFYRPERFVALFELPIVNADYERADTVSDYLNGYLGCSSYFNRISFLNCLCDTFEEHMQNGQKLWDIDNKVIRAIKREFKGLGG